jgi:hypothetical protein
MPKSGRGLVIADHILTFPEPLLNVTPGVGVKIPL